MESVDLANAPQEPPSELGVRPRETELPEQRETQRPKVEERVNLLEVEAQREEEKKEMESDEEGFDDVELSDPDLSTNDKIYGQFESINRPAKKHQCLFKDVIMHVGGTDYIVKVLKGDLTHPQ